MSSSFFFFFFFFLSVILCLVRCVLTVKFGTDVLFVNLNKTAKQLSVSSGTKHYYAD